MASWLTSQPSTSQTAVKMEGLKLEKMVSLVGAYARGLLSEFTELIVCRKP